MKLTRRKDLEYMNMIEIIVEADCNDADCITETHILTLEEYQSPVWEGAKFTPEDHVKVLKRNLDKGRGWSRACAAELGEYSDFYFDIVPHNIMWEGADVSINSVTVLLYNWNQEVYEVCLDQ